MADSTYTGVFSSTAVSVARDCVQGYRGNYIFYVSGQNQYDLVKFDEYTEENGVYSFSGNLALVRITYRPQDFAQQITTDYFIEFASPVSVTYENPDNELFYASFGDAPKLQEGGEYYGFAVFALLCGVCIFGLFARIFRHLL